MKELKAMSFGYKKSNLLLRLAKKAMNKVALILRLVYVISRSVEGKTRNKENSAIQQKRQKEKNK